METQLSDTKSLSVDKPAKKRLVNWNLLRAISMFSVVVVHMSGYLGPIGGVSTNAIGTFAII